MIGGIDGQITFKKSDWDFIVNYYNKKIDEYEKKNEVEQLALNVKIYNISKCIFRYIACGCVAYGIRASILSRSLAPIASICFSVFMASFAMKILTRYMLNNKLEDLEVYQRLKIIVKMKMPEAKEYTFEKIIFGRPWFLINYMMFTYSRFDHHRFIGIPN